MQRSVGQGPRRDRVVQDNPIRSVAKAVSVLDHLAELREATPRELAELLHEPRTTLYRLLTSLSALDLVEPGSRPGSYRLGWKLLRLGSAVIERLDERQVALPVMERIHAACDETVFLCVRRNDDAVCIERLAGVRVQSLELRLGGSLRLHIGAAPRVLLAWEPEEEWAAYIERQASDASTTAHPLDAKLLRRQLKETRRLGYAISDEDVTPGIGSLGVPIFDYSGHIRAAISVGGSHRTVLGSDRDEILRLLLEGGREISTALGFGGVETDAG